MSERLSTQITWTDLARQEIAAARLGGQPWREFVLYAERVTGRPWKEIRELIDPYVAAEYRRMEAVTAA